MTLRFSVTALLALTALPLFAADSATPEFYAAVAMTKAQKNTSTPADSGLYARQASGEWTLIGPRILGVTSVAFAPRHPDVILLGSADGVVRSADAGKTWRKTTGWEVADVRSIVFDPSDGARAYAATAWGPLRSQDGGQTWELAQSGIDRLFCQTVLVNPKQPGQLLLGSEEGLYASKDGAKTWERVTFPKASVNRLARSPAQPSTLLAVTIEHGAWLSLDDGRTWKQTDPASAKQNLYAATCSPQNPALFAIGGWNAGVRISADGGKTWVDRTEGLPVKNIFVLAFDPRAPSRLWVSTFEEGTFFSDDEGRHWQDGGLYGAYGSDFVFLTSTAK